MRILYLTHDLSDPTTRKRVRMLRRGGATVTVAGFHRAEPPADIEGSTVIPLGRTFNGKFLQRIGAVIHVLLDARHHQSAFAAADVIIARNLEMLAIGVRGRSLCATPPTLVYESLDIHRLLLRRDVIGNALRSLEGWLSRRASALITSSPAFVSEYFTPLSKVKLPTHLLENKVFDAAETQISTTRPSGPPWRIGWFGAIRCRKSLAILSAVAKANPGLVEIIIRGRPSYDQFEDFDSVVNTTPGMQFLGPYQNPRDLAEIYGGVHFSWAIDMFEEGLNSSWLLPNRLYEGGLYNSVPLAMEGVETARFMQRHHIGHVLATPLESSLTTFLKQLTPAQYQQMQTASEAVARDTWMCSEADCTQLVTYLDGLRKPAAVHTVAPAAITGQPRVLTVIPCLNEAKHITQVVTQLVNESAALPMQIVIADGGSTDGTVEILRQLATQFPNVTYLHNPKRIQSAAINLAVATYGDNADFLIRIDAHAGYPLDYCRKLVEEAMRTGAGSVVVAANTVGKEGFQKAVAAAQNSKLGNGGSSHRSARSDGRWVEHGHHALMRIAAYRAVHGYDESFTHNEDAELDVRLRRAGHRIWLTAETQIDYYPRSTPLALYRQYRNYGHGRVRTLLKHREKPKLRQLLPVAVFPAALLLLLSPVLALAALPFIAWAGLCMVYGSLIAWKNNEPQLALSGPAAMLMHGGWSVGFWQGFMQHLMVKKA